MIKQERIYNLTLDRKQGGSVIYWMSREQRVRDNPGLLFAGILAAQYQTSLTVVFTLAGTFQGAALRHYDFMLRGLAEVAERLRDLNIPFLILEGDPADSMINYLSKGGDATVIVDFDPLKIKRSWIKRVVEESRAAFIEVDGHNIVPVRFVSDKAEFGAYTLRPKIHRHLDNFLEEYSELLPMDQKNYFGELFSPEELLNSLKPDPSVPPVNWIVPGESAAISALRQFIQTGIKDYAQLRNDPNKDGTSGLSPYLHFGQLSAQRVAIEVLRNCPSDENSKSFLEELIVRKELSDNFCHYNPNYDNTDGFHQWAKTSHHVHKKDEREYIYTTSQFEGGQTHDSLWNAAQLEMVKRGKMHGYMRMYWAKKILEWTPGIEEAMKMAIYLNDKYELDGRDPNGYTGIAWSIGGVHDRAWAERPVFGKIRYMNFNGCKRKFDVELYIKSIANL